MSRSAWLRLFLAALVFTQAMAWLPHPPSLPGNPNDKIQHIAVFACLSLLGATAFPAFPLARLGERLSFLGVIIDNWLSNRVFTSHDNIVDRCCEAWNKLVDQPWRIMTIGRRRWARGSRSMQLGISQIVTEFSGTFEDNPPAVGDVVSLAPLDGGRALRR